MRIATIGLCDAGYSEAAARSSHLDTVAGLKKSISEIADYGLQTDEDRSRSVVAGLGKEHAEKPFDALMLIVPAWTRPAALLQMVEVLSDMPMVLCSPGSPLHAGVIRSLAPAAGAGGLIHVLRRHGIKFKYAWSAPGESINPDTFLPFLRAARAIRKLRGTKLGMIGFGDMRLQSTGFDVQEVHEVFGVEIESRDMLELREEMERLNPDQVKSETRALTSRWSYRDRPASDVMEKVVAMYLVLDRWAGERGYLGVSIKCPTGVAGHMGVTPCLVGSLLARKYHYTCENDIPGLLGQVILGLLSDQMSTYWELYEFLKDGILLGCCGFSPESFLDEPLTVRTFEGFFTGLACCSRVKAGPYTLARLGKGTDGGYRLHGVEGEAVAPPAWFEDCLGPPQHPSVKLQLKQPVDEFAQAILSQHVSVVAGNWGRSLDEFAKLKGIAANL